MKPLSLNMSRYHKIADDGEKSTLQQHDTGHTITIAHKALPREQRNYLKALPIYDADKADPEQEQAKGLARGGQVNPSYGDAIETRGDKQKTSSDENVESNPDYKKQVAQALKGKYQNVPRGTISKDKDQLSQAMRAHYADGDVVDKGDANEPNPSASTPININIGTPNPAPSGPQTQTPNVSNSAPETQIPTQPPAQQGGAEPPAQTTQYGGGLAPAQQQGDVTPANDAQAAGGSSNVQNIQPDTQSPTLLGAAGQEVGGQLQKAKALGALGQQEAGIQAQGIKDKETVLSNFHNSYQEAQNQVNHLADDVRRGFVNPNHYWDNHSKFMTGLGLVLAGFNPTGNPNGALEFLQSNIQRDTQAQMANLGAKQDLLNHAYQMFGNAKSAAEFANAVKTDETANRLAQAAGKSQNAQQAAAFNMAAGQLKRQVSQQVLPLAARQAVMNSLQQGADPSDSLSQLRAFDKPFADSVESHLFPRATPGGGGTTDTPITPEARSKIAAQQNVLLKTQALQNFIDSNTVEGVLSPAHRGEGEALAAELAQFYRQGTGASTSESEQKAIGTFIDQKPGGFLSAYMNDPKLHALAGSMQDSINTQKNQFGFHPFHGQATPEPQPNAQQAAGVQMMNGKPHRPVMINGKKVWRPV
jgi:hypothetical protein